LFSYCPDERRFRQFGEESEELASAATGAAN
jgi:hypothetical protein